MRLIMPRFRLLLFFFNVGTESKYARDVTAVIDVIIMIRACAMTFARWRHVPNSHSKLSSISENNGVMMNKFYSIERSTKGGLGFLCD